jgi:hypothetical protein
MLLHWAVTFLGRDRAQRTITEQQVFGRLAMENNSREIPERLGRILRPAAAAKSDDGSGDGTPGGMDDENS